MHRVPRSDGLSYKFSHRPTVVFASRGADRAGTLRRSVLRTTRSAGAAARPHLYPPRRRSTEVRRASSVPRVVTTAAIRRRRRSRRRSVDRVPAGPHPSTETIRFDPNTSEPPRPRLGNGRTSARRPAVTDGIDRGVPGRETSPGCVPTDPSLTWSSSDRGTWSWSLTRRRSLLDGWLHFARPELPQRGRSSWT